jgi:hypothetical protein
MYTHNARLGPSSLQALSRHIVAKALWGCLSAQLSLVCIPQSWVDMMDNWFS